MIWSIVVFAVVILVGIFCWWLSGKVDNKKKTKVVKELLSDLNRHAGKTKTFWVEEIGVVKRPGFDSEGNRILTATRCVGIHEGVDPKEVNTVLDVLRENNNGDAGDCNMDRKQYTLYFDGRDVQEVIDDIEKRQWEYKSCIKDPNFKIVSKTICIKNPAMCDFIKEHCRMEETDMNWKEICEEVSKGWTMTFNPYTQLEDFGWDINKKVMEVLGTGKFNGTAKVSYDPWFGFLVDMDDDMFLDVGGCLL